MKDPNPFQTAMLAIQEVEAISSGRLNAIQNLKSHVAMLMKALQADEDALQLGAEAFHAKHGYNVSEVSKNRRTMLDVIPAMTSNLKHD